MKSGKCFFQMLGCLFGFKTYKPKERTLESLVNLLTALSSSITALQAQLVDAQAAAKSQYDAGFAAGAASVPVTPPSDKIYSQADLDAAVAAAVAPLQAQVSALQAQVDALPQQIADAVAAAKAELKALALELVKSEDTDLESKISGL